MPDIFKLVSQADRLAFSQNIPPTMADQPLLGDTLFPDMKTRSIMAEYLTLASGSSLPTMATVHALDTEAEIGSRPVPDMVKVEKLLIKRKINQTESLRLRTDYGAYSDDEIIRYIKNDMGAMARSVKTRTEVAKMEVLATGKMLIKENNVNIEVGYGVPAENMAFAFDWSLETADVIGDIQKVVDAASDAGYKVTGILTSGTNFRAMTRNKAVQTAIYGGVGVGIMPTMDRVQSLFEQQYGFPKILINNEKFNVERSSGNLNMHRYYQENKLTFLVESASGGVGVGLWGVTPEEEEYGQYNEKSQQQFITVTQWATPDPVAVWTKASGMFIPVLPNPKALFVATVTTANP